jgi:hypothetical protein
MLNGMSGFNGDSGCNLKRYMGGIKTKTGIEACLCGLDTKWKLLFRL